MILPSEAGGRAPSLRQTTNLLLPILRLDADRNYYSLAATVLVAPTGPLIATVQAVIPTARSEKQVLEGLVAPTGPLTATAQAVIPTALSENPFLEGLVAPTGLLTATAQAVMPTALSESPFLDWAPTVRTEEREPTAQTGVVGPQLEMVKAGTVFEVWVVILPQYVRSSRRLRRRTYHCESTNTYRFYKLGRWPRRLACAISVVD